VVEVKHHEVDLATKKRGKEKVVELKDKMKAARPTGMTSKKSQHNKKEKWRFKHFTPCRQSSW